MFSNLGCYAIKYVNKMMFCEKTKQSLKVKVYMFYVKVFETLQSCFAAGHGHHIANCAVSMYICICMKKKDIFLCLKKLHNK